MSTLFALALDQSFCFFTPRNVGSSRSIRFGGFVPELEHYDASKELQHLGHFATIFVAQTLSHLHDVMSSRQPPRDLCRLGGNGCPGWSRGWQNCLLGSCLFHLLLDVA
eukprot:2693248-Amphidinium_carterae.1